MSAVERAHIERAERLEQFARLAQEEHDFALYLKRTPAQAAEAGLSAYQAWLDQWLADPHADPALVAGWLALVERGSNAWQVWAPVDEWEVWHAEQEAVDRASLDDTARVFGLGADWAEFEQIERDNLEASREMWSRIGLTAPEDEEMRAHREARQRRLNALKGREQTAAWKHAYAALVGTAPNAEAVAQRDAELDALAERMRAEVVSLGRQNGRSEIAAALGLWALLVFRAAYVVGIASSREPAALVYKRTLQAIQANPALARRFERMTDTRGIASKAGSLYELKAAKGALQEIPVRLAVCDELHLLRPELWSALVAGTSARADTLVAGITTAGDDDSTLLIDLYERGAKAIGDPDNRLGFFVWEAPEARVPEDDNELLEFLATANPSLASGRIDAEAILSDVRSLPEADILRYRLNVFTKRSSSFVPAALWQAAARQIDDRLPAGRPVFTIDRTPDWGFASIAATVKDAGGIVWTEMVASIVKPSLEQLVDICTRLNAHSPVTFAADSYSLRPLLDELKRRGMPTYAATLGDVTSASALFYSLLSRGRLRHADEPLLAHQIPRTVRKNVGDAFRVSRKDSGIEIDAVMATLLGAYVAETVREPSVQVF